jgi:hypothetical protein
VFPFDDTLITRIKAGYRQAVFARGQTAGMWRDIDARRADLHDALIGNDTTHLRALLSDPLSTDLYYGVDGVCRSIFGKLQDDQVFQNDVAAMLRQSLTLLFMTLSGRPDVAFARLDELLGHKVEFPSPFRGEIGLATERGLASERAIAAIYQAALLLKFSGGSSQTRSVVEIGPGMGRTAYYSYRAGFTDYTTIDLPMGVVAQACFLAAALGPDAIWLPGEDPRLMDGRIKLLHYKPDRTFDIAINVDSLPEMDLSSAFDYVMWINTHARQFISINHEQNPFTVAQLGAACLRPPATRSSHPMRQGYFEEIFDIAQPRSNSGARARLKASLLQKRLANWAKRVMRS